MLCLLVLQEAHAIDISFSASNNGGSVSIWDVYDVDDSVAVSETSSASFSDGVSMANSRHISGPGEVEVIQRYSGSDGVAAESSLYAKKTTSLEIPLIEMTSSSNLKPDELQASQKVSVSKSIVKKPDGSINAEFKLEGDIKGDYAEQYSRIDAGTSLTSEQNLNLGEGAHSSQKTSFKSRMGECSAVATDPDGNFAEAAVTALAGGLGKEDNMILTTDMTASAGDSASASQKTLGNNCDKIVSKIVTWSPEESYSAHVRADITNGGLEFSGEGFADSEIANARQNSLVDAGYAVIKTMASYDDLRDPSNWQGRTNDASFKVINAYVFGSVLTLETSASADETGLDCQII